MTERNKYIRFKNTGFVIWKDMTGMFHSKMAAAVIAAQNGNDEVVSAGFMFINDIGSVVCYGESESLGIKSRREDDKLLAVQFYGDS